MMALGVGGFVLIPVLAVFGALMATCPGAFARVGAGLVLTLALLLLISGASRPARGRVRAGVGVREAPAPVRIDK